MRTRRRIIKSPTKGRRSSIICVKKSPIARRNPRRNLRNLNTKPKLASYDSPLHHLRYNGPSTSTKSEEVMESSTEIKDEKEDKKKILKSVNVSTSANMIGHQIEHIKEESNTDEYETDNMNINHTQTSAPTKCTKRSKPGFGKSGVTPNSKKRKLKKSPLSRFNETSESNKLLDSVILVDDSELVTETKPVLNNPIKHTISESLKNISLSEPVQNSEFEKAEVASEEVVVIDENETLMEMEAYHNAFNQSANSIPNEPNVMDSIIVIDPDDEVPDQKRSVIPKPSEDCFVVWSSLPKPSTSNTPSKSVPVTSSLQSLSRDNNWDSILKCDKILLDTNPKLSNLRYLNNENNKPPRKKVIKSPKIPVRGTKASSLKTLLEKCKATTNVAAKGVTKVATKTKTSAKSATTAAKSATAKSTTAKSATTTGKKKTKNNGELIFLSESKEDETATKKTKSNKSKLREIVIDGNNVAMAFTHSKVFSEKGIKMLIDYFTRRGHTVKVFVPQYRRSRNCPLLEKWYEDGIVIFTPSRKLGNKTYTPYDDRYILEYATACNGIVVSQDQFRDLYAEKPQYRDTIENRLLVPTFVGDYVMFPEDPLGRDGPTLAELLKH